MEQGLSHRDDAGNGAFGRDVGAWRFGIRGPVRRISCSPLVFFVSSCLRGEIEGFSPTGKPKGK